MKEDFFESIKVLSYFLWEYTKYDNALRLWCCAEDIVCFFSENNINSKDDFMDIISMDKNSPKYKNFMRKVAYKIFEYTGNPEKEKNWYIAEKFLRNYECIEAGVKATYIFNNIKKNDDVYRLIRSENVKNYIADK